jgi:transposase-like protein
MSRRLIAPLVVAAAVGGGGIAGAVIGVPAISSAQDAPEAREQAPDGATARSGPLAAAADALGMDARSLAEALRSGKTIADIAQEKDVDLDAVIDAMVTVAVANGRDEATAREAITKLVNEGRPDGHGHHLARRAARAELDAAAAALGMERSALVQELRDGKTIAQVAEENGVDVDTVIEAMVAPVCERITEFVNEGGRLTPDDGD